MDETINNKDNENKDNEKQIINQEHNLEDIKLFPISSAETIKTEDEEENKQEQNKKVESKATLDADFETAEPAIETAAEEEQSPIFKELAQPKLPELPKENRARLQMQSPNRLYFYWSIKNNPFQTLNRAFHGNTGIYRLVVKLVNQTTGSEEIHPVEAEGSWWFDVDSNSVYQAEIGFYAPNRPFIRVLFSNTIETPRKSPSPRRDYTPHFTVSANHFAKVLDRSGFRQDAFEVVLAGDDLEFAETATQNAFSQLTGTKDFSFTESGEFRYALLALASGETLDTLRGNVSRNLFASLEQNAANISADNARNALEQNFGAVDEEFFEEEDFSNAVFGASIINFPRVSKRRVLPKFAPVSSLSFRF